MIRSQLPGEAWPLKKLKVRRSFGFTVTVPPIAGQLLSVFPPKNSAAESLNAMLEPSGKVGHDGFAVISPNSAPAGLRRNTVAVCAPPPAKASRTPGMSSESIGG